MLRSELNDLIPSKPALCSGQLMVLRSMTSSQLLRFLVRFEPNLYNVAKISRGNISMVYFTENECLTNDDKILLSEKS